MSISVSTTANTPFQFPSNIINDSFPPVDEESGPGADIPSVFANTDIDFNLKFSYIISSEEEEQVTTLSAPILEIKLIGESPFEGADIEIIDNETVRVSGRASGLFGSEVFRFLFANKTELNLPPDNNEDWIAIVKWAAPGNIEETATYNFEIEYDNAVGNGLSIQAGTAVLAFTQFVYWNVDPSLNAFKQLVAESGERLKTTSE
jgi:hypothetical protein